MTSKRFHVVFTDADTGEVCPDHDTFWQDSFEDADAFAARVQCHFWEQERVRIEADIFDRGEWVHGHNAPKRYQTWN